MTDTKAPTRWERFVSWAKRTGSAVWECVKRTAKQVWENRKEVAAWVTWFVNLVISWQTGRFAPALR